MKNDVVGQVYWEEAINNGLVTCVQSRREDDATAWIR